MMREWGYNSVLKGEGCLFLSYSYSPNLWRVNSRHFSFTVTSWFEVARDHNTTQTKNRSDRL